MEDEPKTVPVNAGANARETVFYKNRYLYSKIAPEKSILKTVAATHIPERVLVLGFSPALCYGVRELAEKLPENSALVLIETDPALFQLACERLAYERLANGKTAAPLLLTESLESFERELLEYEHFKRVIRIDFSAGVSLNAEFYDGAERQAALMISRFWKNRATLMYLGRLYCRNLFLNLPRLSRSRPLPRSSVERPILVIASGPSTDIFFANLTGGTARFFLIAADTALPALVARGIAPDLVVQVEAQFAIEAAFVAAGKKKFPVAADLVSRQKNADYYFFSRFTNAAFIDRMRARNILGGEFPAMGSVALYAVEIALMLRAREDIPVFVCGIDFAFVPGKTHCNGTPAHTAQIIGANRLRPAGDVSAAFRQGARRARGKNGAQVVTDSALHGYRDLFSARFSRAKNLFDAGAFGLPLGIPQSPPAGRAACLCPEN